MIASLAPCFAGNLHWYKETLALPGVHERAIAGRGLLEKGVAEDLMSRFADTYPGADRHALVSMWTQWHFGMLVIPATAAALLLDRELPVDLDTIAIVAHESGRTAALVIQDEGRSHPGDATERFSRLFEGHVEPLIHNFAGRFGVSRRLLWTNAAAIFEWTLQQVLAIGAPCPAALEEGRALLQRRSGNDGRPNPICGAVLYPLEQGQPVRRRKVCCLRYLLPGVEDCGSLCPLPHIRGQQAPA
ncbi:siderophore-iron reductase FhuF [Labrys sp. KNU-23]|uniref:siderophore-iron reductase FhuF n=1 Tax=Labrys sp. KNU-23 TaxID=2789216 RepID=UPI00165B4F39|nr:siderophore-iron reductase FhuF [Labrys sp. KNU-23]